MIRFLLVGHAYVVSANRGKLASIAADPEIDLHLVCPDRWPEPEFGERVADPKGDGYTVHTVPVIGGGNVRRARYVRSKLAKEFRSVRPDFVQIEQEPASWMAFQCTRLARKHGARTALFTWDNVPGRNRFPLDWLARYNLARSSHVLAGNQAARALVQSRGTATDVSVLPQLGIDDNYGATADGDRVRRELALSGFVVGFIARLVARKGAGDLLEAFADMTDEATLLIVGDGPERSALAVKAKELDIVDRVRFAGAVGHGEVADYLAAIDCLVLPSHATPGWAEQFGHVLIEAMAMGVPVIGSDSGAIPEVIGDAGLIYPEGDTAALLESLKRIEQNTELRKRLADKGRARVHNRYSNRAIAERTVVIARKALDR